MIGRCLILLLISCDSLAQTYLGPTYQALGFTGAALRGIYSLTANPAGLAGLERPTVSVNYQHHFLSADIRTQSALVGLPTRFGVFGMGMVRHGLSGAYSDTRGGLSYAKPFGHRLSVGLTANYHQLYIPAYVNVSAVSMDVGIQCHLPDGSVAGVYYTNVGGVTYGGEVYGVIPSFLKAGLSYPLPNVVVVAEMAYSNMHRLSGHFGIDYGLGDIVHLRGGLSLNPLRQYAGLGICWQQFILDAAATFHPQLGTSPQIGVCYAF